MSEPQLLALFSSKPGQGKTTAAHVLVEDRGYQTVSFATPLKTMAKSFLIEAGFKVSQSGRYIYGDWKDELVPGFDFTGRQLQIKLGEAYREIDPEVWVKVATTKIGKLMRKGYHVVVDDMRRRNELEGLMGMGAKTVFIYREDRVYGSDNQGTEGQLNPMLADFSINNKDDVDMLRSRMNDLQALVVSGQLELI